LACKPYAPASAAAEETLRSPSSVTLAAVAVGEAVPVTVAVREAVGVAVAVLVAAGVAAPFTDPALTPFRIANGDWAVSLDGSQIVFLSADDRNLWLIALP
jgi:hypothetical protein